MPATAGSERAPRTARPIRRRSTPSKAGSASSSPEQICNHHRRRLERIGWQHALEPPAGGWAAGDPPPRPGNAIENLIDGAAALPAMAEALRAASRTSTSPAGTSRPASRSNATASRSSSAICSPSWPTASTCACSSGQVPAAALPPVAPRCAQNARSTRGQHEDPVRARREGAADALPPREDDRDRRPDRVRRRNRSHLRSRATATTGTPSAARRPSAGTTRARASRDLRSPTWRSTSGCGGPK